MTSIVFTFVNHSPNSIIASNRIVSYVAEHLKLPIVDKKNIDEYTDSKIETLFIVNGAYAFCPCLEQLAVLIKKCKKLIWIQNDYTIIPPIPDGKATSPFRKAFRENYSKVSFWTTCEDFSKKQNSHYVNWNMLTFDPLFHPDTIRLRRKRATKDLFYYGSYREGRKVYFDRYFGTNTVQTTVSCPTDAFSHYQHVLNIGPMRDKFFESVGSHGLGLYIEDKRSHSNYHSPANRFYEMLSAGLPMVFQQESGTMLRRAGFNPDPFVAQKPAEVARMMDRREEIGQKQRELWVRDFRKELLEQFNNARKSL